MSIDVSRVHRYLHSVVLEPSKVILPERGHIKAMSTLGPLVSSSLECFETLPDNVTSYCGFSIADLDRDGKVEIVFGTDDGLLHCWELGSCTTGYAPWPQFQHDCGRSGALE